MGSPKAGERAAGLAAGPGEDPVERFRDVFLPAAGTTAGTGKPPSVPEYESAGQALCGGDRELLVTGGNRPFNVGKVGVNFLLLDFQAGGNIPGREGRFLEKIDNLLAEGSHGWSGTSWTHKTGSRKQETAGKRFPLILRFFLSTARCIPQPFPNPVPGEDRVTDVRIQRTLTRSGTFPRSFLPPAGEWRGLPARQ